MLLMATAAAWRLTKLMLLLMPCLLLSGCTSQRMSGDIRKANEATAEFYQEMSAGQYDVIYSESSDNFKAAATREKSVDILRQVNQKTGACASATPVLTSYHIERLVDLTYTRKCANIGEVTEKFSWRIVNGKARLESYCVTNPAFSTK
jgi:hypothetical protein